MTLLTSLSQFNGTANEDKLLQKFNSLAPVFLYGGYIEVGDEFKIYIKTVEFYFHSETTEGIHDPIVYHRNGKGLDIVPYFPIMTLHAHNSGFDITFESPAGKYRASALIRAYEVKDKDGNYLKWITNKEDNKKSKFERFKNYQYNTQSTYLYTLLNGFSLGISNIISWVDSPRIAESEITNKARQGVNKYILENGEFKKIAEKCERKWSFTREDKV